MCLFELHCLGKTEDDAHMHEDSKVESLSRRKSDWRGAGFFRRVARWKSKLIARLTSRNFSI